MQWCAADKYGAIPDCKRNNAFGMFSYEMIPLIIVSERKPLVPHLLSAEEAQINEDDRHPY